MSQQTKERNQVHHNWPQIMVNLIQTQIMICIWGRATGKTEGLLADYFYECVRQMPRSLGGIISVTYDKMLTFIIPKLIRGWARLGYRQNEHYWVRQKAPEHLKRPVPFLEVTDPKHFIHHWNGAGQQLISMDRKGKGNAADLDYLGGDEMRFVKQENYDEVDATVRGNEDHFGHLSLHHSRLLCTDMPRDGIGTWLLDYEDLVDEDVIEMIINIQQHIFNLREKLEKIKGKRRREAIEREINKLISDLNELRSGEVYVSYASTLENIHALGIDVIKNYKRVLSDYAYQLGVLNEKVAYIENGFYPMFDESIHSYTASDHAYMDRLQIDDYTTIKRDCRWDKDCRNDLPLHIGLDHNKAITCIVVGQQKKRSGRNHIQVQNSHHVLEPKKIKHCIDWFAEYYKYREGKTVYYHYDHNSKAGNSSTDYNFADEVQDRLRKAGFTVIGKDQGQAAGHDKKYNFFSDMMAGTDPDLPTWSINTTNNEQLIKVLKTTNTLPGGKENGFEKDKRKEKQSGFPQEDAPHITDAHDILIVGMSETQFGHLTEQHGGAMLG